MNKIFTWPLLAVLFGTFPFLMGIVFGAPFQFSSIPQTSRIAVLTVWLIWFFSFSIFLMEFIAAVRGKVFPLLLPSIQRPLARAISNSLIMKMTNSTPSRFKKPLVASPVSTQFEENQFVEKVRVDERVPEFNHRACLAKVVRAAAPALDSKLRNRRQPKIVGISIEPDSVKVILDDGMLPPEGFNHLKIDGKTAENIWEIKTAQLGGLPTPEPGELMLPLLVCLGYHKGSSAFYLNLEKINYITIRGEHFELVNYLEEILNELVGDDLTNRLRIFCVGMGYEAAENPQVMVVERVSDILPAIEKQSVKIPHTAAPKGLLERDFFPILILDPFTDRKDLISRIELTISRGISAIIGNGRGEWTLEVTETQVNLSPFGLQLARHAEFSNQFNQNGSDISSPEIINALNIPLESENKTILLDTDQTALSTVPASSEKDDVEEKSLQDIIPEIEILGAVRVKNPRESFASLQSLSLVCYLGAHRNGASSDQLMRWLWPAEQPPNRSILANVISRARRALGDKVDGSSYINYDNGIYRLDEEIQSDYEQFLADIKKSEDVQDDDEALKMLSQALDRVKGVPFSVGSAQTFQWSENGLRSEIEFKIDMMVHRLVDIAIKKNEFSLARSALTKGIMCIPGCEQCIARQLIISAKTGNIAALIEAKKDMLSAYKSLEYKVPEGLLDLYENLSRDVQNEKRSYGELQSI